MGEVLITFDYQGHTFRVEREALGANSSTTDSGDQNEKQPGPVVVNVLDETGFRHLTALGNIDPQTQTMSITGAYKTTLEVTSAGVEKTPNNVPGLASEALFQLVNQGVAAQIDLPPEWERSTGANRSTVNVQRMGLRRIEIGREGEGRFALVGPQRRTAR